MTIGDCYKLFELGYCVTWKHGETKIEKEVSKNGRKSDISRSNIKKW